MPDRIIFHQYDSSPFSEKVRVVFGIKGLEWHAVDQPVIMPKPDLTCLTGGYRKIPVMQIGADIYCDTQIIIRELEKRFPSQEPAGAGLGYGIGFWTDRVMFQAAVGVIFGGLGDAVDEAFVKDREALMGRPFDTGQMAQAAPLMKDQLRAHGAMIEDQLAGGRAFLLGETPGVADAHAYYNIWFVRSFYPEGAKVLDGLPKLIAWETRVKNLGHGTRHEMTRDEAITIATAATSTEKQSADADEPNGFKPGDRVTVMADDYGRDPITGTLVSSSAHHIAIARHDDRVGDVTVHFPRAGFWVIAG